VLLNRLAQFESGEIQSASVSCRVLHDDGRTTWIKSHLICREYRPQEQVIDMLGINYDITALKQTEQELIAAKERAEERLRQKLSIQEYYNSKAALARAMARLKAARK